MSKQYIVFFGCGKTTFCKTHLNWVELDIGWYEPFRDFEAVSSLLYFYPRWGYNLLIGGGANTLQFLDRHAHHSYNNMPWIRPNFVPIKTNIIIPSPEMKQEILERIKNRSCARDAEYIMSVYDKEWEALDKAQFDTKVYLKPGQYLSDIIDENGEYKPGIEVIYGNK